MRKVFLWFWNFTSYAGLTQCREADNKISKGAWFILAIIGYAFTWYTAANTIKTFFENRTDTKILFETGVYLVGSYIWMDSTFLTELSSTFLSSNK